MYNEEYCIYASFFACTRCDSELFSLLPSSCVHSYCGSSRPITNSGAVDIVNGTELEGEFDRIISLIEPSVS